MDINWDRYEDVLESRDEFGKLIDSLEKAIVKGHIRNNAANGKFLTDKEYQRDRVHINSVHNCIRKLRKEYGKRK